MLTGRISYTIIAVPRSMFATFACYLQTSFTTFTGAGLIVVGVVTFNVFTEAPGAKDSSHTASATEPFAALGIRYAEGLSSSRAGCCPFQGSVKPRQEKDRET